MSEEILVNVTPQETRVALLENGVLQEVYIERAHKHGLVSNIYKGKVSRVLPGMQAAFVEVGLARTAFLHVSDVVQPGQDEPAIRDVLTESQHVLVQVIKDPLGSKGARLTTKLSIPSRFLVFLPGGSGVGVSTKIEDDAERKRLKSIITQVSQGSDGKPLEGGFIVRTAGEAASIEALRADMLFLRRLWESIKEKAALAQPGQLVHGDLPLVLKVLRDLLGTDVDEIHVDSKEGFNQLLEFAQAFVPDKAACIQHYQGERPIFDLYNVEDEIQRALERKVFLKSGGYLVVDQTEAMTTIDVNTGGYVGHRNLEETIFKTNLEAAQAIARQLRLRNLGGIIIIDFIDMMDVEHQQLVMRALEKSLARDSARSTMSEVSPLGLVEMTRKRTRESLEHVLCEPCPACQGRGSVKSAETVCYEIFREIMRSVRQFDADEYLVLANSDVVGVLLDEQADALASLEEFISKPIKLQAEQLYSQEQFDVVLT